MRSPEGEEFDGTGCILEVIPNERLVWSDVELVNRVAGRHVREVDDHVRALRRCEQDLV